MRYIGSKKRLLDFIEETIEKTCGDISDKTFCDLFSGTACVAGHFKPKCKKVYSNDLEQYSFVVQRNYIGNARKDIDPTLVDNYNNLSSIGLVTKNLSPHGKEGRMFFTEENAMLIDGCREKIEEDFVNKLINEDEYYFLLCSLIESLDKVGNTTGVYGAYLKSFKSVAKQKFKLVAHVPLNGARGVPHQGDANEYIKDIEGDILYLDPPYNSRQYGGNYHVLNYVAMYEDVDFIIKEVDGVKRESKTALFEYNKSSYSVKRKALESFKDLISNVKFKYIFLSYNDEGIMSSEEIKEVMSQYGDYSLETKAYQRYKSNNKEQKQDNVEEQIHVLIKKENKC